MASKLNNSEWRLRDAAAELVDDRKALLKYVKSITPPDTTTTELPPMSLKAVKLPLIRISDEQVRKIFDIAANTVLETLKRPQEEQGNGKLVKTPFQEELFSSNSKWANLRSESLSRAQANKEYTKFQCSKQAQPDSVESTAMAPPTAVPSSNTDVSPDAVPTSSSSTSNERKFSRNTPASSAAALDARLTSSRAALCATGNIAFGVLTPGPPLTQIPQSDNAAHVATQAHVGGTKIVSVVETCVKQQESWQKFRHALANEQQKNNRNRSLLPVHNPFDWKYRKDKESETEASLLLEAPAIPYSPSKATACTEPWKEHCIPRFLEILRTGGGNAVYHDLEWTSRHARIADLLQTISKDGKNYGPHLIVTTEPEVTRFVQEFPLHCPTHDFLEETAVEGVNSGEALPLRVLPYVGTFEERQRFRQTYFGIANGLPDAPVHIIVTSYSVLFSDYLSLCQVPFHTVLLDEGLAWLAAAQGDAHSLLRTFWEAALWAEPTKNVFHVWDFGHVEAAADFLDQARIGLSARHRILTASAMGAMQRSNLEAVPVSALVRFLVPQLAHALREEWDRSRIASDSLSMQHFRKLVARGTVVYGASAISNCTTPESMEDVVVKALSASLPNTLNRKWEPPTPRNVPDEEFVATGKVTSSRRWTLAWLSNSWLRYELGVAHLEPILDAVRRSNNHGYICNEIATASSTTSSGATGQVAGTLAYRLAVRCGRQFGSEQGLRQHVYALHASPGTWLCRTCSVDCSTSQARTHHERSCGAGPGTCQSRVSFVDSTGPN